MAVPRWKFTNPANADEYEFQINPTDEDEFGLRRNVEHSAATGNGRQVVLQQSQSGFVPMVIHGKILHKAQRDVMVSWYLLCENQTIRLLDHEGIEYLGVISEFVTRRKRTVRNPRDAANAPTWYWEYDLTFEIVTVLEGAWA